MNKATAVKDSFAAAIAAFGKSAKSKLSNPSATGSPEDQLRAPFERLLTDLAQIACLPYSTISAVGESSIAELKTRPDYAVTVDNALVGFVELKAPGKGADPRKFKDAHDRDQWDRLSSLPNLLYADGNEFSLWHSGTLASEIVRLEGNIEFSGATLKAPPSLLRLFELFFSWQPIVPRNARELAHVAARLCRLLRDEVTEQLGLKSEALTALATDWRKLLFPDATDEKFADGYAQAVTFGMLMARAKKIALATGLVDVGKELSKSNSLIGTALRLLTENVETQETLKTALATLIRVLDAVDWHKISKGDPDAWLYFYEDFLAVYDNKLRRLTGSYYTPPQVVHAMVGLAHEALQTERFGLHQGLASPQVTIADPAVGTGTFILGVLRRIAETVSTDEGEGAVKSAIHSALHRLIAFEMQLGPFSVAQLRVSAEIGDLIKSEPNSQVRMFVTNTLGNPYDDEEWIPGILAPIGNSRKEANKIKREEPITVVIGNPPYKEKAKGLGGWVETRTQNTKEAPLDAWIPPSEWGLGAHLKHLRNLYIYFWRWATWKIFDYGPGSKTGIVSFISVSGFLGGPGFEKMRDYLRRTCDEIWVVDCSPEGHQPEVSTRIFQGVQQPICIVMAVRSPKKCSATTAARVWFRSLPHGSREEKFTALLEMKLSDSAWTECPGGWRDPFLPKARGVWSSYPALEDFFVYHGSGVQPKRTWVIAPDSESLLRRWQALISATPAKKEELFHATLRKGQPADRHINSVVKDAIPGYEPNVTPLAAEKGACLPPVRYAFRSFNRQWIIPDARVITQPNAELWRSYSTHQVYLTALTRSAPSNGPALTFSGFVPDLDHYKGSFGGRVFPLWRDAKCQIPNIRSHLVLFLTKKYGRSISPEDVVCYLGAIAAHPAYTATFKTDLSIPGLRIPLTADATLFSQVADVGRDVIWLHTFGERMTDPKKGRPAQPPRMAAAQAPRITAKGAIPGDSAHMPDSLAYDDSRRRLIVGQGFIDNVDARIWGYEVSGKQVLAQWFSYRKANRERPIIGDRRLPSALGNIQPDHWLPEYTTELINLLNVLGLLVELEPRQAILLEQVCSASLLSVEELISAGALDSVKEQKSTPLRIKMSDLFET